MAAVDKYEVHWAQWSAAAEAVTVQFELVELEIGAAVEDKPATPRQAAHSTAVVLKRTACGARRVTVEKIKTSKDAEKVVEDIQSGKYKIDKPNTAAFRRT